MHQQTSTIVLLYLLAMVSGPPIAGAQQADSLIILGEIEVRAVHADGYSNGILRVGRDRLLTRSATDAVRLFDHVPGLSIRQSGSTGAALASFRGLGSASTRIELDGIRLMDPATGTFDLSLVPLALVSSMQVQSSSAGATVPGGRIMLETPKQLAPAFTIETGSFGRLGLDAQAGLESEATTLAVAAGASSVEGDFPFRDPVGIHHWMVRRQDADRRHASLFFSAAHKWQPGSIGSARQPIQFRLLALGTSVDRGIPSLANTMAEGSRQQDDLLLGSLNASAVVHRMPVEITMSSVRSHALYRPLNGDSTRIRSHESSLYARIARNVAARWLVLIEPEFSVAHVQTRQSHSIRESGVRLSVDHFRERIATGTHVSGRFRDISSDPTVTEDVQPERASRSGASWSAWFSVRPLKGLSLRMAVGRVIRFPSLNELFWVPGGNSALQPERGIMAEWSLTFNPALDKASLTADVTFFISRMADRITWRPALAGSTQHIWTASNVSRVHGSGVETLLQWQLAPRWNALASFTHLIQEDRSNPLAASFERQLRFAAPFAAALDIEYHRNRTAVFVSSRWTGRRYTATDESSWMPSHNVVDAGIVIRRPLPALPITTRLSLFNLLDSHYESFPWMPMPGREWRLVIVLER
jgi:iron complex outermembrane receptor protein